MKLPGSVDFTASPDFFGVGIPSCFSINNVAVGCYRDEWYTSSRCFYYTLERSRMFLSSHSSLRVQYCAALAKGQLSDHPYRGEELVDSGFLDFLVNTSEIDIAMRTNVTTGPCLCNGRCRTSRTRLTMKYVNRKQTPVLAHAFNTHSQSRVCRD